MTDYDFRHLNPRSFEQMVQALAVRYFGLNVLVFGDGPDGGREATFNGQVSGRGAGLGWNGYGVIQAKFKTSLEGTRRDGAWAVERLRTELDAFFKSRHQPTSSYGGRRRDPQYYVFATNVALSAVPHQGAKDRCIALLEEQRELGLRDYMLWDRVQLCALLDDSPEIRSMYLHAITSDVLRALRSQSEASSINRLIALLGHELHLEQFVALDQAGDMTDPSVRLAQVFLDLPYASQSNSGRDQSRLKAGRIVQRLLDEAGMKFDPASRAAIAEFSGDSGVEMPAGRFVILGGPGQGKTTVGQFLCQLFRYSLLIDHREVPVTPEVAKGLDFLTAAIEGEKFSTPIARRFPVRVSLSEFAKELAVDKKLSLLRHVADTIRSPSTQVTTDDLESWLRQLPWFLVLDGLDEVPRSANRNDVLVQVHDFLSFAAALQSDLMVLATTRPQGYTYEFSPDFYEHLLLEPLPPSEAMRYARRLASSRYAGPERRTKVLRRLDDAVWNEMTSHLMQTPLQVTIMATLVDSYGPPPNERWSLFNRYYETLFNRERQRDIPESHPLRDFEVQVNQLHARLGLHLQVKGELAGGTDARISFDDLQRRTTDFVARQRHPDPQVISEQIVASATNRLVFLVGTQAGAIGFELRSLQEFMSCERILEGSDSEVRARLLDIARPPYWRNTFLFCASRAFAKDFRLQDTIVNLCAELNDETGTRGQVLQRGSELAIDILEEGSHRANPSASRLLVRHAFNCTRTARPDLQERLARLVTGPTRDVFANELETRLAPGGPIGHLSGVWNLLIHLFDSDRELASELLDRHWPDDFDARRVICALPNLSKSGASDEARGHLAGRIRSSFHTYLPWRARELLALLRYSKGDLELDAEAVLARGLRKVGVLVCRPGQAWAFEALFTPLERCHEVDELSTLVEEGSVLHSALTPEFTFCADPSASSLATALSMLARSFDPQHVDWLRDGAPWPLAAVLSCATSAAACRRLASEARAGKYGDIDDWNEAEDVNSEGFDLTALARLPAGGSPLDPVLLDYSLPFQVLWLDIRSFGETLALWKSLPQGTARWEVAAALLERHSYVDPEDVALTTRQFREICEDAARARPVRFDPLVLNAVDWKFIGSLAPTTATALNTVLTEAEGIVQGDLDHAVMTIIEATYKRHPGLHALAALLAGAPTRSWPIGIVPTARDAVEHPRAAIDRLRLGLHHPDFRSLLTQTDIVQAVLILDHREPGLLHDFVAVLREHESGQGLLEELAQKAPLYQAAPFVDALVQITAEAPSRLGTAAGWAEMGLDPSFTPE